MRATDFLRTPLELLDEASMSPSSLKQMAAQIGATAGMEFEMIVNDANDSSGHEEPEPDYDSDERPVSIDNVVEFFDNNGEGLSRRDRQALHDRLYAEFYEWQTNKINQIWNEDGKDVLAAWLAEHNHYDTDNELQRDVEISWENKDRNYRDAYEAFKEEESDNYDDNEWIHETYELMSEVENEFGLMWPHWTYVSSNGTADISEIAAEFKQAVNRKVNHSSKYHGAEREPNTYAIEPDSSISPDSDDDAALEFVSPPLPLDQMLSDLDKVITWAKKRGCYTNDSTGLHMNVSIPGYSIDALDYVKLALFMGDHYVLQQFGRIGNTYCKSALSTIQNTVKSNPFVASEVMSKMRQHLNLAASKLIHDGITSKYTSINAKSNYIEFRSPGGDWLNTDIAKLENTLLRFVVALSIAIDPEKYKQEYAKKLYKLLAPKQGDAMTEIFTRYSTGNLTKEQLKSLLDQQATKSGAPLPDRKSPVQKPELPKWIVLMGDEEVYEVKAATQEEATKLANAWIQKRSKFWQEEHPGESPRVVPKPNPPQAPVPATSASSSTPRFEIYNANEPSRVMRTFYARDMDHAREEFRRILASTGSSPAGYGFRQAS